MKRVRVRIRIRTLFLASTFGLIFSGAAFVACVGDLPAFAPDGTAGNDGGDVEQSEASAPPDSGPDAPRPACRNIPSERPWIVSAGDGTDQRLAGLGVTDQGRVIIGASFNGTFSLEGANTPISTFGKNDALVAVLDEKGQATTQSYVFGDGEDQYVRAISVQAETAFVSIQFRGTIKVDADASVTQSPNDNPSTDWDALLVRFNHTNANITGFAHLRGNGSQAIPALSQNGGKAIFGGEFGGGPFTLVGSSSTGTRTLSSRGSIDGMVGNAFPDEFLLGWSGADAGGAGGDNNTNQFVTAIAVEPSGGIVVGGRFSGSLQLPGAVPFQAAQGLDGFVTKLTANGNAVAVGSNWPKRIGGNGDQRVDSVAVAPNGNIIILGMFSTGVTLGSAMFTSQGLTDVFVAVLSPDGDYRFAKAFGGLGTETAKGLAVDQCTGEIVIGLQSNSSAGIKFSENGPTFNPADQDLFIVKLDPTLKHVWTRTLSGPGLQELYAIAVHSQSGDIFAGGAFENTISLPEDAGFRTSGGGPDIFVARMRE